MRSILMPTVVAVGLAGCETFSADGGIGPVQAVVKADLGKNVVRIRNENDTDVAKTRAGKLLRTQLTAETAVQIALLNNRGLQAAYDEIGISEAQFVQARACCAPMACSAMFRRRSSMPAARSCAAARRQGAAIPGSPMPI